jgi:hypothetical protein
MYINYLTWPTSQLFLCSLFCLSEAYFLTVISEIFSATDYLLSTCLTHKIYLISMILKPASNRVNFCLLLVGRFVSSDFINLFNALFIVCLLCATISNQIICFLLVHPFVCPCVHEMNTFSFSIVLHFLLLNLCLCYSFLQMFPYDFVRHSDASTSLKFICK